MTLGACIQTKAKAGQVSKIKGKAARDRFHAISQALIKEGEHSSRAYALAADAIVKEARDKAARAKHRLTSQLATMEGLRAKVDAMASGKDPAGIVGRVSGKYGAGFVNMVNEVGFEARAEVSRANGRIGEFLLKHRPSWLGKQKDPASIEDFVAGIYGEPTSNLKSKVYADAVSDVNEYFRVQMNSYGYNIGKHEKWGLPHSHDALAIEKAGDQWIDDVLNPNSPMAFAWDKMKDPRTGQPFPRNITPQFKREVVMAARDNMIYGKASKDPQWGRAFSGNPMEKHRIFEFRDSKGWLAYNAKYGATDPFNTVVHHIDRMSRELAMARTFGVDAPAGLRYAEQYALHKAREAGEGSTAVTQIEGGAYLAGNMLRYMKGSLGPKGRMGAFFAKTLSTTRKVLNAALLDRAVVIGIPSDLNSAMMAAKSMGMNQGNILKKHVELLADIAKGGEKTEARLLRSQHILDSWANPSAHMDRYQQEYPSAAVAEILSNAVMRAQGMNAHTDGLRIIFGEEMAGFFKDVSDLPFDEIPEAMRKHMQDLGGITADVWDDFRLNGDDFIADNGAAFLDPHYWRATTKMDADRADFVWLKMQTFVEKSIELAVPTGSLIAKGAMDPIAFGLHPGTITYEVMKSAGMFKSFPASFMVNQHNMIQLQADAWGKAGNFGREKYVASLLVRSTLVGALAMQVGDMLMGRDPQPMDNPDFWFRAILRGGGLGPVGDILATGSASWGGGLGSYMAGPVPQFISDTMKLTTGNLAVAFNQWLKGEDIDTKFGKDLAGYIKRYMPGAQSPILAGGSAFDRMIVDQLWMALDPGALDALNKAAKLRENNYGNKDWWGPGGFIPQRLPNPAAALGG